jgi:hypothetical protein
LVFIAQEERLEASKTELSQEEFFYQKPFSPWPGSGVSTFKIPVFETWVATTHRRRMNDEMVRLFSINRLSWLTLEIHRLT